MKIRFRAKFGISSLMMLTVIVAGCVSFLTYRIKTVQRENDAVERILSQKPNAKIVYQHQLKDRNAAPVGPAFLRRWLGENIFSNVAEIEFWEVGDDFDFQPITAFKKLKRLKLTHPYLTTESFQSLKDFPSLPQVESLFISMSPKLTSLDGIENLPNLTSLHLNSCDELANVEAIESLQKLETLFINQSDTISDVSPIGKLPRLNRLCLRDCESIKTLKGLESLTNLKSVNLGPHDHLESIEPLSNCTELRSFSCEYCGKLESIDALAGMRKLEDVSLRGCGILKSVSPLSNSKRLRFLDLNEMYQLKDVGFLASCSLMEELGLPESVHVEDASVFEGMSKLRSFSIYAPDLKDLHPLQHLESLEAVTIFDAQSLKSLAGIDHHSGLKNIVISSLKSLEQATFAAPSQLEELVLTGVESLRRIEFLKPADQLRALTVLNGKQLEGIEFSTPPQSLQFLRLVDCLGLNNGAIDFTSEATSLNFLTLEGLAITELPDLSGLTELNRFHAESLQHLNSLAALGNSKIEFLRICKCDALKDFSFLEECRSLKNVEIKDCRHYVVERGVETP